MPRAKSWEEHKVECEAVAKEGIAVLGWVGEWKGNNTRLLCKCEKHGEWDTTTIRGFKAYKSCRGCKVDKSKEKSINKIEDNVHIKDFIDTRSFLVGTIFTRNNNRVTTKGYHSYWDVVCPVCSNDEYVKVGLCSGVFTAYISTLKQGQVPCRCTTNYRYTKEQWEYRLTKKCRENGHEFKGWKGVKWGAIHKFIYICPHHGEQTITPKKYISQGQGCPECKGKNQQKCYINLVEDNNNTPLALKIGIAKDPDVRIIGQNNKNLFQMSQMSVYEFPTVQDCKDAEKACLTELKCGILNERELKDGHTETTSILNYDKVVSIYERFGGVKVS